MQYAPICLFTYNRLWHTQETVKSLLKNELAKESELFVFSDGPKNKDHEESVAKVRNYLRQIEGFKRVTIIEQEKNLGLANSIISGVTKIVNQFGSVIVVEDDLFLSPHFLNYMNDGLNLYKESTAVASIHGYTFPIKNKLPETFFVRGADCWGWATWKRAWDFFEADGVKLLKQLEAQNLCYQFDYHNTQKNVQMLKDQINGKNNSWAIRWHASAFLNNMLTLYPGRSLVQNIGLDNSGEHCNVTTVFDVQINHEKVNVKKIQIEMDIDAFEAFIQYFKNAQEPLYRKIIRRTKALFHA